MTFILGIIPARGGSKGIPSKNIAPLNGLPLLYYTTQAAKGSKLLSDVILSTDDADIANLGDDMGLKMNGPRPATLSTDTAKTIDVVRHEVEIYEIKNRKTVDAVVLLQPTSPLRTGRDIDAAIEIFNKAKTDSLISVHDAASVHPSIMYREKDGRLTPFIAGQTLQRRQDMDKLYVRSGAVYIATRGLIMDEKRMVGDAPAFYEMPRERSYNIDEPLDLEIAAMLLKRPR